MSGIGEFIQSTIESVIGNLGVTTSQTPQVSLQEDTDIKGLLKYTVSSEDDCTICLDSFTALTATTFLLFPSDETCSEKPLTLESEDHSPVELPCGHKFGASCVIEWLHKSKQCPLCRSKFDTEHITFNHKLIEQKIPCSWVSKYRGDFILPTSEIGSSIGIRKPTSI